MWPWALWQYWGVVRLKQVKLKNGELISIREATALDAKEMLAYIHTISGESDFLTFGEGEFNMSVEQEEAFLNQFLKQDNALFIIAELDGKIVGNLSFAGGAMSRIAHTGELGVSVLKQYWGRGIGTALMDYLISWCKETGIIRKVNLKVRSDNHMAIYIYKKLGFQEEGLITREFYVDGRFYDSVVMGLGID